MERARRIGAVLLVAGVLIGCGGDDEPGATATTERASEESTTTTSVATSTTARPTTTTLLDSGPVLVESTVYPYALTLPAEEIIRPFEPATRAWNGSEQVIRDTAFLDDVGLTDGFVHILGIEWPDDVQSLVEMFADHSTQHNGCSPAQNQREVTVGGAPALVFTVDSCGFGGENLTFVRVAALHNGFGLIAFTPTLVGQESADSERLLARLSGLEWRTS